MTGIRSQRSMKIVASERTMGFATVRSSSDNLTSTAGPWINVTNRYLGLKFKLTP